MLVKCISSECGDRFCERKHGVDIAHLTYKDGRRMKWHVESWSDRYTKNPSLHIKGECAWGYIKDLVLAK